MADKKFGRAKRRPSTATYKSTNRAASNKARRIARAKEQRLADASKKYAVPRGTARAARRAHFQPI